MMFTLRSDGCNTTAPAGAILELSRGESLSFDVLTYHAFWGQEGAGDVLLTEIAMSTPLPNDNIFYEPKKRFPPAEEDEEPLYLLCGEYPDAP